MKMLLLLVVLAVALTGCPDHGYGGWGNGHGPHHGGD